MSQPIQQPYQMPQQPPQQPVVRLPTWVNVVLVLILLASCGANNDNDSRPYVDTGQIADQVVTQLQSQGDSGAVVPASSAEIADLCRLLGALAAKEKVPLTMMDQEQMTQCHQVAQDAATATTP